MCTTFSCGSCTLSHIHRCRTIFALPKFEEDFGGKVSTQHLLESDPPLLLPSPLAALKLLSSSYQLKLPKFVLPRAGEPCPWDGFSCSYSAIEGWHNSHVMRYIGSTSNPNWGKCFSRAKTWRFFEVLHIAESHFCPFLTFSQGMAYLK